MFLFYFVCVQELSVFKELASTAAEFGITSLDTQAAEDADVTRRKTKERLVFEATSNKCIASTNKCLTSSNKGIATRNKGHRY